MSVISMIICFIWVAVIGAFMWEKTISRQINGKRTRTSGTVKSNSIFLCLKQLIPNYRVC
jgi:hypothetical protein